MGGTEHESAPEAGRRILLIRHGRPDFVPPALVGRDEVGAALARHRAAAVTEPPPASLVETLRAREPGCAVTSDLPRARTSAALLGLDPVLSDPLWAEAELPHPDRLPVALPWGALLALCRLAWLVGYRAGASGRRADLRRAGVAADRLVGLAAEHGSVALVAHGIVNRMIRRELEGRGWRTESRDGDGHWSRATLSLPPPR